MENYFEKGPEHIPTPEEVLSELEKLLGNKFGECVEVKRCEDDEGLYLLEVTVPGDEEGEITEYAYLRKGSYKEGGITETNIHATYYDKDGMPFCGRLVGKYVDKQWKFNVDHLENFWADTKND